MNILITVLIIAGIAAALAFFSSTGSDWRERLTETAGAGFGTVVIIFYFLVQLALLAGMGWLAWKFLTWLF